jgi:hypothetical protein
MQINLHNIDWKKVIHYIITIVLCLILFNKCGNEESLLNENKSLSQDVKQYKYEAKKYIDKNNALNEKVALLEFNKQKIKKEIDLIKINTKHELAKTNSLSTKEIASYYQKRYKKQVVITQYGVALKDSVAKQNIKETIEKDGCLDEIKLVKKELAIEESKLLIKDSINLNLSKAYNELEKANSTQEDLILNVEKSLKKERVKKKFWQITTGAVLGAATYLIMVK